MAKKGKKTGKKVAKKKAPVKKKSATKKKKTSKKSTSVKPDAKTGSKTKGKRSQSVVEAASGAEADKQGYVFINGRRVRMISTQGKGITRKPKKTAAQGTGEDQPKEVKLGKTKLSKKELRHYRDLLLIKRAELVGDLSAMEAEALRSSGGNISHMPIHMADIGSDTYEQDFMLGLAEAERKQIREIDDALLRIKEGTYGVCQMTGKPIPKARLDAKPWAKYTIEAARKMEGHWQP
jgi:DnaK suppressor protein